jgi:60 kDa SS-A/Ro ribonucleoprotein
MANRSLFTSFLGKNVPKANTVNNVGGLAYALSAEAALAQYAATGCMNGTYYASAENQLDDLLKLTARVNDRFIARTAVYCREKGFMKDVPALLCAVLANRDVELLAEIFPRVIDNGKMLRNFVQILRSGVTGRKSLGSAPKRLVRQWLDRASDRQLVSASVGQSPSLADVVKMVHPTPDNAKREAFYAWLIGKPYDLEKLPSPVREYEAWKLTKIGPVPEVPFQMLTALNLGQKEWTEIARNAPWQMTRMNLNTFARHGVFKEKGLDEVIAKRLTDRAPIKRSRVFPYQLLAAYLNAGADVPKRVTNALQTALEIATENIPKVPGHVVICPDVSGSMHQAVTGNRKGSTSKVRCLDVAALIAAAILRKNPEALVLPFMNDVVKVNLNPHDSIMTNAQKLASLPAGGTNCSAPLTWLNKHRRKADFVFFVSDNESWIDSPNYGWCGGGKTQTMKEWQQIKQRSPKAKMACLDIQPNASSQAIEREDIMNIGGFSDQVFEIVSRFAKGELDDDHLVGEIKKIELRTPSKSLTA